MTYVTICDARQPVSLGINSGDRISIISMSIIYDFYNIISPQEIIKIGNVVDNDEQVYFQEYPEGTDFNYYYVNSFEQETGFTPTYLSSDKIKGINLKNLFEYKLFEYGMLKKEKDGNIETSKDDFDNLCKIAIGRFQVLNYYKITSKMKYITIGNTENDKILKYPSLDSGMDDYIYDLVMRDIPKASVSYYKTSTVVNNGAYTAKIGTIDDVLIDRLIGNNRKYYFDFIKKNFAIFNPHLFLTIQPR